MDRAIQSERRKRKTGGFRAIAEPLEERRLLSVSLIHPGSDADHAYTTDTVIYQGELYSVGWDADHGTELWKSDGTTQGSSMVKDITPGSGSSEITSIQLVNGLIFFTVSNPRDDALWTSDGTENGTFQLLDHGVSSKPQLVQAGNQVVFSATNELGLLWTTDGTAQGTHAVATTQLRDWNVASIDSLVAFNGAVCFTAFGPTENYGAHNVLLLRTDGTDAGTSKLYEIPDNYVWLALPGQKPLTTTQLTLAGDVIYFATPNFGLWQSGGSTETTAKVKFTLNGLTTSATHLPATPTLMEVDGRLLAYDRKLGWFITDGTTATPLPNLKNSVTTDGTNLYFSTVASSPLYEQFWRSDGMAAGDTLLASIPLREDGQQPYSDAKFYASSDGLVYFTLTSGTDLHSDLWAVGDTPGEAFRVDSIDPGEPVLFNDKLYFSGLLNGVNLFSMDPNSGAIRGTVTNPYANSQATRLLAGVTIFLDLDSNGVLDAGESSAVTDGNGQFAIYGVTPGQYTLGEIGPSDSWRFFGDQLDSYNKPAPITVTVNVRADRTDVESLDLADTSPAIVAGNVFRDLNGNNNPDSGEGESFTVCGDLNYNGKFNPGEPSTRSAANGNYQLSLPNGGSTVLHIVPIKGWDVGQYNTSYRYVAAVPGQTVTYNFPVAKMELVSGAVFLDSSGNGKQNKGELGIAKVWIGVHAYSGFTNGVPKDLKVRTDASGHYSVYLPMIGYPPLTYTVEPSDLDSQLLTTSSYNMVNPKEGTSSVANFGVLNQGIIAGGVSRVNEDFSVRITDTLLNGWKVFIDQNRNGKLDRGETSVVTQATQGLSGLFTFAKMRPGSYTVCVIPRSGFKAKAPTSVKVNLLPGMESIIEFQGIKL